MYLKADKDLLEDWTEKGNTRSMKILLAETRETGGKGEKEENKRNLHELTAKEIIEGMDKITEAIRTISGYKRGYKGTSLKVLREAADVMSTVTRELARR